MNRIGDEAKTNGAGGIVGVTIRRLDPIADVRGGLTEIHRDEWNLAPRPVQWDFITTKPRALRGVHVHCLRWDYIVVLEGRATIGLKDLRRDKESFGRSMLIAVAGESPAIVTIPPGVAHGIFADSSLLYLYGLTVGWNSGDEDLGCRYDDRELGLDWPAVPTLILQRDLELPDFATLLGRYEAATGAVEVAPDVPA